MPTTEPNDRPPYAQQIVDAIDEARDFGRQIETRLMTIRTLAQLPPPPDDVVRETMHTVTSEPPDKGRAGVIGYEWSTKSVNTRRDIINVVDAALANAGMKPNDTVAQLRRMNAAANLIGHAQNILTYYASEIIEGDKINETVAGLIRFNDTHDVRHFPQTAALGPMSPVWRRLQDGIAAESKP